MTGTTTLAALNVCTEAEFVALLHGIFEHAPWIAATAAARRPFLHVDALHDALLDAMRALPDTARTAFLRGHPELAGEAARSGTMTAESIAEQGTLGLAAVDGDEAAQWARLNAAYREKFGFPFILCIRMHTTRSALRAFEQRLANDPEAETAAALREIALISRLRIERRVKDQQDVLS